MTSAVLAFLLITGIGFAAGCGGGVEPDPPAVLQDVVQRFLSSFQEGDLDTAAEYFDPYGAFETGIGEELYHMEFTDFKVGKVVRQSEKDIAYGNAPRKMLTADVAVTFSYPDGKDSTLYIRMVKDGNKWYVTGLTSREFL